MPTFFTDADTAPTPNSEIARILSNHGLSVECHNEHFPDRTPDFEWLRLCGESEWIAITKDQRIRFCWRAKLSIMRSGAKLFVMIGQGRTHRDLALNFANTAEKVVRTADQHDQALIARVYMARPEDRFQAGKPGRVSPWLTYDEWREMEHERDKAKESGDAVRDRCA